MHQVKTHIAAPNSWKPSPHYSPPPAAPFSAPARLTQPTKHLSVYKVVYQFGLSEWNLNYITRRRILV